MFQATMKRNKYVVKEMRSMLRPKTRIIYFRILTRNQLEIGHQVG